jgi:serine/threonine protein kinase
MVKQIPLTLKQFCAQLTDHDLIGQQDLSRLLQQCESAGSDDECLKLLAKLLIRESPLTLFQMQQVYAGKTASLFLKSYIIEGKLGDGGKGMVLKARHRHMDRHVAIKVLSPKLTKNADLLKRFRREMKALAALDHPNIVSAYDAGEARGIHFLVMQYVDGQDLSSLVKRSGPLSPAKTLDYLIQGCHGLRYAHERGMLFRNDQDGTRNDRSSK